jgi:subtilisin family serine protease
MTGQTNRLGRRVVAAVATLFLAIPVLPGTSWTSVPVDPALDLSAYALVRVDSGASRAVAAKARSAGAGDVVALEAIDVVIGRLSNDALRALRTDPRVAFIAADAVLTAAGKGDHFEKGGGQQSPGVAVIDAPGAWPIATGKGITVALMDTGVARHPDLDGSVLARLDFVKDGARQPDPSGHGTFVAGLIAGHGKEFKGVAPDAKLISLRVLDGNGNGSMHSVLAAFDWLLDNRVRYGIRVLNLSFGARQSVSYHRELLAGVVESAHFAGVVVVSAAGNDGPATGTVSSPGTDPFVVTAGSLADQGTAERGDDRVSVFSGRGPTRDGFEKPDVLAPGEHVVSLRVPGTELDRRSRSESQDSTDSLYGRLTGTSASSAMVAGVAALVLEAHRSYTPTKVKGAIVGGARKVTASKTPAADADTALNVKPARVNERLIPSAVLIGILEKSGQLLGAGVSWEGISWEGISWESVSWEGVSWESVSWEAVSWESVSWEAVP